MEEKIQLLLDMIKAQQEILDTQDKMIKFLDDRINLLNNKLDNKISIYNLTYGLNDN
jgi:hypothetical protein